MKVRWTCRACKESAEVEAPAGGATEVGIVHEDDCPFYLAIEAKKGEEWAEENGYPIDWETLREGEAKA